MGPVGVVCIQQALRRGLLAGIIAGLGAALADAFFGAMAAFGVSLLSHVMTRYQILFQMISSLILLFVGIKVLKTRPQNFESSENSFSYRRIFFSTLALTLTNPLTMICFAAVFASLGLTPVDQELLPGAVLTIGVLLGAAAWWVTLSISVVLLGKKFPLFTSPFLNRISGGLLAGCGCVTTISVLKQLFFFA